MPAKRIGARDIKRQREQAARDRQIYQAVVVDCQPRKEISKRWKLTERRVLEIVASQDKLFRLEFPEHIAQIKDRQTARLEHIYEEAMQAWERSKLDAESETVKDIEFGDDKKIPAIEKSKTRKGQVGNSTYLDTAMKALEDIRKIWGVEAAKKVEVGGSIGLLVQASAGAPTREEAKAALIKRIEAIIIDKKADSNGEGSSEESGTGSGEQDGATEGDDSDDLSDDPASESGDDSD